MAGGEAERVAKVVPGDGERTFAHGCDCRFGASRAVRLRGDDRGAAEFCLQLGGKLRQALRYLVRLGAHVAMIRHGGPRSPNSY